MQNKKIRIRSAMVFCLFLTFTPLATPARAQGTQPAQLLPASAVQADSGFQAAKTQLALQGHAAPGRLTICTSFTRVNTITDPVAAKAAAAATSTQPTAQGGLSGPSSQFTPNTSTDATSAQNISTRIDPSLNIPLAEIPIDEVVTNPVTVTVMPDGGVHVEVSGSGGPNEKLRAVTFEVNLAKCSAAFRYATPTEQAQLDADAKQQQQSNGTPNAVGAGAALPGGSAQTNWQDPSGWAYRALYLQTRDPIDITTAQTVQNLTWAWSNPSSVNYWSDWRDCWGAFPTRLGTYWYISFCSDRHAQNYYGNSAAVSNEAVYWNANFAACQATAGTAYAYHYVNLVGYPYGWYNWNANWYHWGAPCAYALKGVIFSYGST